MNPSFGRGRGRRQVLQLGNSGSNSSYLARYGYQSLSEDPQTDRRGKSEPEKAGLSRLVGAYDDSDSEPDEDVPNPAQPYEQPPVPPAPVPMEMTQPSRGEGQALDSEVASFLAEINAISTDDQEVDHNDIPLPPGAFIPRDQTAELMERREKEIHVEESKPEPHPKKSNSYSMFVKGGSERLGDKGSKYSSVFVKGGTEVLKQNAAVIHAVEDEEEYQLPKAPTTVWQQCQDENTKYMYYWNFVTNEVTWNIPPDYTQYLLLQKEYEDKLARIPEDVRKRLEAKKLGQSQTDQSHLNGNGQTPAEVSDTPPVGPQLQAEEQVSNTSSPSNLVGPCLPENTPDSPKVDNTDVKPKSKHKKSKKHLGPTLPENFEVSSTELSVQDKAGDEGDIGKITVSEVDSFVSELLASKNTDGGGDRVAVMSDLKPKKQDNTDVKSSSENEARKEKVKETEEMDFDIDDIDAALELALERKTAELKKLDDLVETKESKHSKSKKHDKRDKDKERDKKRDKHRSDSHKSDSSHKSESRHKDRSESKHKSDSRQKRSSHRESDDRDNRKDQPESQAKKARLVAAYDDDSEEEETATSTTTGKSAKPHTPTESTSEISVKSEPQVKEELTSRPVPHHVQIKDEVEDAANIALGKLEFLEVTKKGLSKLQVLLLELQTRFRDWQDGGLDTQFFLCRLQEANRQLEQYEESAVPPGFSCHWDRNFRRYFYTSEKTGESQWDYPEPAPVSTTSVAPSTAEEQSEVSSSKEPAIPEVSPPSPKPQPPPPPPPPPDEEEDLPVYGPHLPVNGQTTESAEPDEGGESLANLIDGEPMPPDSSDENVSEEVPKPPEPDNSEQTSEVPPVFPGEPPPPGTEVLFGLPPPPPPSEPYPGDDDTTYSVDHDSPDDADMDVDEPDTPKSTEAEDSVSSSHQDYHLPSIQASSSSSADLASVSLQSSEAVECTPVIYRPPQLNVAASSSSLSVPTSVISAQPVINAQPVIAGQSSMLSTEMVPQSSGQVDMFADTRMSEEISSTSAVNDIPPPPLPQQPEGEKAQKKEKKKKKEKSITSSSLSLKKKNVSSLVQKWQQVKVQVEEEEKVNEERQMAIRQKLEEWKREQAHS